MNDTWNVATPFTRLDVPIPFLPSKSCTCPVGVPAPGGIAATVAATVTSCLRGEGFGEDAKVVVVCAALTVSETVDEPLDRNPLSPEYVADTLCVPTAEAVVARTAVPPLRAAAPRDIAPSKNSTRPVGVPFAAETLAVKVTV